MKGIFGFVGLIVALAIVGLVVRKQLASTQQALPQLAPAAGVAVPGASPGAPAPTVREQSQQIQQQVRQATESVMQQPRPMPEDK